MLSLILLFIVLVVTVKMMIIIIIINVVIITVISSLRYIEFLLHFPSLYLSKDKKTRSFSPTAFNTTSIPPPYISFSLPIISYWISSLSGLLLTSFLLSLLLFFSLFLFVLLLLHSFLLTLSTSPS